MAGRRLLNPTGFPGEHKHNTVDQLLDLGSLWEADGCLYRYVRATTAVTAGQTVTAGVSLETATNITGFKNTGDRATGSWPYVEDSGLTMTPGIYVDGYVYILTGTGLGQMKRIVGNTATRIYFGALHPWLGEKDPFTTAPDLTSDIVVIHPWHVIPTPVTTKTALVLGVAPAAITALYYGFIVESGVTLATVAATAVVGAPLMPGDDTVGTLLTISAADMSGATPVGYALHAGGTDQKTPVLFTARM